MLATTKQKPELPLQGSGCPCIRQVVGVALKVRDARNHGLPVKFRGRHLRQLRRLTNISIPVIALARVREHGEIRGLGASSTALSPLEQLKHVSALR